MAPQQKEIVDEIKIEWKRLWRERHDDKVRAEGVAIDDYSVLFIDKGTIIHATRDFKALNFKDILEQHEVLNTERYISPDPQVGGWTKFVKDNIKQTPKEKLSESCGAQKTEKQQLKKNGRGWLHR